jgi:hypothetical protein
LEKKMIFSPGFGLKIANPIFGTISLDSHRSQAAVWVMFFIFLKAFYLAPEQSSSSSVAGVTSRPPLGVAMICPLG